MAVAAEISSTYANTPAVDLPESSLGTIDANLVLRASAAVTATGSTTAIDVEGGGPAEFVTVMGAVTGTTPTATFTLECSVDGGSTYKELVRHTPLTATHANAVIARRTWIPRPTGANRTTKVRVTSTIGGTTPSFTNFQFLRHLGQGDSKGLEYLP